MKKVIRDKVVKVTEYEAVDGTVFQSETECKEYELTAKAVLGSRVKKLEIETTDMMTLLCGDSDTKVHAYRIINEKEADIILQFLYIQNPYLLEDADHCKARVAEIESIVETAWKATGIVLLAETYDNGWYFVDSLQNIISRLNELNNKK